MIGPRFNIRHSEPFWYPPDDGLITFLLKRFLRGGINIPRIYTSPSSQESNVGIGSFGTEEANMNKIADALMSLLDNDGRFEVRRNTPGMDVYEMAEDSNHFKADIHVAIYLLRRCAYRASSTAQQARSPASAALTELH